MIQKIKIMLVTFVSVLTLAVPAVVAPVIVSAATDPLIKESLCSGAQLDVTGTGRRTDCAEKADVASFQGTLTKIINIISIVVGVVAVIMIIFGGFKYITSGGTSEKVTGAKNTILYGLIGLIVVALAQIIVKFVLNQAAEATK